MVDDLIQEAAATGKAIVTISVDLITAIAEACRRSEQQNPGMSTEQKEGIMNKLVNTITSNYKETHGSLKTFNREGAEVTHIDVSDEKVADAIKKSCKKAHLPVDIKEVTRADGTMTYTVYCEVKNVDQLSSLLKSSTEQVLEDQKAMTKTLVLYDEKGKEFMSVDFVKDTDINMDDVENQINSINMYGKDKASGYEIKSSKGESLSKGEITPDVKEEIQKAAKKHNPKKDKSLSERIKDKKQKSQEKDKNRQREKTKKKSRDTSL